MILIEGGKIPVGRRLPYRVECSVEHVQEHGTDIAVVREVHGHEVLVEQGALASVAFLEVVATTPDDEGEDKERDHGNLGARLAAEIRRVEADAEDPSTDDLR